MKTRYVRWWCHECMQFRSQPEGEGFCGLCGHPMSLDAPVQTRKPKAQRPPATYFEQTLARIERDLSINLVTASEQADLDDSDDLPF